jgi:hypothetical protein
MNPTADAVTALNAEQLAEAYKSNIQWDELDRSAWFFFYRDQLREWVFFTDQRTFKERYDLAQQNGLEGFCSWVLGDEDPAIRSFRSVTDAEATEAHLSSGCRSLKQTKGMSLSPSPSLSCEICGITAILQMMCSECSIPSGAKARGFMRFLRHD